MFFNKILIILLFISLTSCSQLPKYKGHGEESISELDLKKYSPKELPPGETENIQRMLEIRNPGSGPFDENAKYMFLNWNVTGQNQVWKVKGPLRFPVQFTGGQDSTYVNGLSLDGETIFLSRDQRGNEYPGIFKMSKNGGELETIFYKDKARSSLIYVADDNIHIYYRTNDRDPNKFAIYKYNLLKKTRELLFEKSGYWSISYIYSSKKILLSYTKSSSANEYWLFNEVTKEFTPLLGQDEDFKYQVIPSPQENTYFVLTDKFSDYPQIYKLHNNNFEKTINTDGVDIPYITTDRSLTKFFYGTNKGGYLNFKAYDAKTLKPITIPNFEGATSVYLGYTTRNGRYSAISVAKSNQSSTNYVYDWKKKKLNQWTYPSHPEVDTTNFAVDKIEYYPARDGAQIPMLVKRPKQCEEKTCPVIVNFHGGPEAQARPGFSPYSQLFINEGFIYVRPNVRGSRGYGKKWLDADNGANRLKVITDIEDCANFIKKNWNKTGKPKVGIMGGSYGGYSALVGMTMFAGAYDAGSANVGMSSLITFLENTAPYRRKHRESEYGSLDKDREALRKLSPITYINNIKSPLQIIHGANDPRVPVGEALQIQKLLESKNIDSELLVFADEGHGVRKRKNQVTSIGHILRFFKKHLK